eukprot:1155621-Pelagomonas_calceolata.AAC.4
MDLVTRFWIKDQGNGWCRDRSSVHLRFVSACHHHAAVACSSGQQQQQRGGWCGLAEACGMQLVLWREACMGRWRSGVGNDEDGPSAERRHGRHG